MMGAHTLLVEPLQSTADNSLPWYAPKHESGVTTEHFPRWPCSPNKVTFNEKDRIERQYEVHT